MGHLVGRHDRAGDQVGKGQRCHMQPGGAQVVALVGVFVELVATVGADDQVDIAAVADRDRQAAGIGAVAFTGRQRSAVVEAAEQHIVAAEDAVQRQVDAVLPLALGGFGAEVADDEVHRCRGAGGDAGRHHQLAQAQIRSRVEADIGGMAGAAGVVVACRAVLVELRRAAAPAQAVGDHAQPVAALYSCGQAQLLGAAVALAGVQTEAVVEAAQQQRLARGADQQHRVLPGPGGAGGALVEHRPAQLDQGALGRGDRCCDAVDQQIRRRRQLHRHRRRMAAVVVGVGELERPAGGDVDVPVARDAVGQAHVDAVAVAVTGGQCAEVASAAQLVAAAATIGLAAEPDAVGPLGGIGRAYAGVVHRPA